MNRLLIIFLFLTVSLVSLIAAESLYFYQKDNQKVISNLKQIEKHNQESLLLTSKLYLHSISDNLKALNANLKELDLDQSFQIDEPSPLLDALDEFILSHPRYSSISLIDLNNKKIFTTEVNDKIVINKLEKLPKLTNALSGIINAFKMPNINTYITQSDNSSFQLSFFQHFEYEDKQWIIRLNYDDLPFADAISHRDQTHQRKYWLVNSNGGWVISDTGSQNPFSLAPKYNDSNNKLSSFSDTNPELWQEIQKQKQGQIDLDGTIYTFAPLISHLSGSLSQQDKSNTSQWILISHINIADEINTLYLTKLRSVKLTIMAISILCLMLGLRIWQKTMRLERKQTIKRETTLQGHNSIIKNSNEGIIILDELRNVTAINQSAANILEVDIAQTGHPLLSLFSDTENQEKITRLLTQVDQYETHETDKLNIRIELDPPRDIELIAIKNPNNPKENILLHIVDTTYWVDQQKQFKNLSQAVKQSEEAVIISDTEGTIEFVNASYEITSGEQAKDLVGLEGKSIFDQYGDSKKEITKLKNKLDNGERVSRIITVKDDEKLRHFDNTISPIRNDYAEITHYISKSTDITERLADENKIHQLENYDVLTNLPNRQMMIEQMTNFVSNPDNDSSQASITIIRLNLYSKLNHRFDKKTNDKLLLILATRIKSVLTKENFLSKISDDEFAIFITDKKQTEQLSLIKHMLHILQTPITIDKEMISIAVNIGIAFNKLGTRAETLIKNAYAALARAKNTDKNEYVIFSEKMAIESIQSLQLESELRKSVGTDQYEFYYQPKIRAGDHALCGVEALLRWRNEMGIIQSPAAVIPQLESTGLIIDVGYHMIHDVCNRLSKWQKQGHYFDVAINISARQLLESNLVETIKQAVEQTGCDPQYLELELTESILMFDVEHSYQQLTELRELGLKISIDDFGTGFSSLSYLSRFPINILKIDREFVKDLPHNEQSIAITKSIIDLAHSLNLIAIAEGVETVDQVNFLEESGIDQLQGFCFSQAVSVTDFESRYLARSKQAAKEKKLSLTSS